MTIQTQYFGENCKETAASEGGCGVSGGGGGGDGR